MREKIINLTNHLITANCFDDTLRRIGADKQAVFIKHVSMDLRSDDVKKMSPGKLGEIMALFEIGDVVANTKDIVSKIGFQGDCEDLLRELVSVCLAYAIWERLNPGPKRQENIPLYKRKFPRSRSGSRLVRM